MKSYQSKLFFLIHISFITFLFFCCFQNVLAQPSVSSKQEWSSFERIDLIPTKVSPIPSNQQVSGRFGNVKFRFPGNMVSDVEYDNEPGWGETRVNKKDNINHDDFGIRSMYMRMRITNQIDKELESKSETDKNRIYQDRLVTVGLNANSYFGDGNGLEKRPEMIFKSDIIKYEQASSFTYGLITYVPVKQSYEGFDEVARRNLKKSEKEYFFSKNIYGRVNTFIDCSKSAPVNNTCRQIFYPDPKLPVELSITYRKKYLPYWMELQIKATQIFLSYKSN